MTTDIVRNKIEYKPLGCQTMNHLVYANEVFFIVNLCVAEHPSVVIELQSG